MIYRSAGILVAWLAVTLMAGEGLLGAQEREAKFWVNYRAAVENPSGFAAKRDLVQKNKIYLQGAITYQIFSIANAWIASNEEDVQDRIKLLDDLGRMYKLLFRSSVLDKRVEFARSLDADKSQKITEAFQTYTKVIQKHNATPKKSPQMVEELIAAGMEAIEGWKAAGEDYLLGDLAEFISGYYHMKEDYVAEANLLVLAKRCYGRHDRTDKENYVALQLRKLESDHGVTLGKEGAGGATAKRKEKKVRPEAKKLGSVKMTYKKDKGPEKFDSPLWYNFFDHMLWRGVTVEKNKPVNWPLGDGSVLVWEGGSKLFLDVDNTGKKRVKLKATAGTQKAMDIPIRYARGEGKYRINLRGLGEREKFLGGEFNFSSSTMISVRIARACHLEGTFQGIKFSLIDDNVNGKYDDFGADQVQIGKNLPQPLSPIMDFGGKLYSVYRVKPDGSEVFFEEYVGDTGQLQIKWNGARGVTPTFLVVQCTQGEFVNAHFNVAGGQPVTLPDGTYQFKYGLIQSGQGKKVQFVTMTPGRKSEDFKVEMGKTTVKEMGAPFQITCAVRTGKEDGEVMIAGKDIKIFGAMNEQYVHFYPNSFAPVISIRVAGGGNVASRKKTGRPDNVGLELMWYPKDFPFKGSLDRKYEVKVDLNNKFLGKVKGAWNEAEVINQ